ncbi:MAG: DUF2125 domain-containing protein [Caulobacteraceae bacterium]|nr:MAG: DUF2125 domain-containing protein [Caulobacteraceae bacterium]
MPETLPDPAPRRKRSGVATPFILLLILIAAWSGGWFWLRGEAMRRMDETAKVMGDRGYRLTWGERTVSGYPFRLDIYLKDAKVSEPSGWALSAPVIKSEAFVYALKHWVFVAPQGVTFTRPDGGAVIVQGKALRASLSDLDKRPPTIAIEGADLTFSPEAGAKPYFLSAARQLNVRILPGPNDLGGVLLHIGGAKMALQGLAARATEGGVVDMDLDLTLTKMSALSGQDWESSARAWAAKGGVIQVRQASVTGGAARLSAKAGTLTPDASGRLSGDLDATLGDLTGTGQALQGRVSLRDGKARIGPLEVGPSPRVW